MTTIFVAHKVRDFASWKVGYDADRDRREQSGMFEGGHFHSSDDPNSFFIVWKTDLSPADAEQYVYQMFNNPELEALMEEAGVLEKPTWWIAPN